MKPGDACNMTLSNQVALTYIYYSVLDALHKFLGSVYNCLADIIII